MANTIPGIHFWTLSAGGNFVHHSRSTFLLCGQTVRQKELTATACSLAANRGRKMAREAGILNTEQCLSRFRYIHSCTTRGKLAADAKNHGESFGPASCTRCNLRVFLGYRFRGHAGMILAVPLTAFLMAAWSQAKPGLSRSMQSDREASRIETSTDPLRSSTTKYPGQGITNDHES